MIDFHGAKSEQKILIPKHAKLTAVVLLTYAATIFWIERRQPLRNRTEDEIEHLSRNGLIGFLGAVVIQILERPLASRLSKFSAEKKLGILNQCSLPPKFKLVGALILLDYTLYLWHVLAHKLPGLWRFHVVHHIDRDLDAATAIRFHFGELAISVIWRLLQIMAIGVTPEALLVWQNFLFAAILFHHSNIKLPTRFETIINLFVVTPKMHEIHHSVIETETDSNWSSGLTIWDRLHGTFKSTSCRKQVTIGVPAYRRENEVRLLKMLALPFTHQRSAWSPAAQIAVAPTNEV